LFAAPTYPSIVVLTPRIDDSLMKISQILSIEQNENKTILG